MKHKGFFYSSPNSSTSIVDFPCSRTKTSQSYEESAFLSKNDQKQAIFAENSKFFGTLRRQYGVDVLKDHDKPF